MRACPGPSMISPTNVASGEPEHGERAGPTEKDVAIIVAQWRQVQIVREDLALREANLLSYEQHLVAWQQAIQAARVACVSRSEPPAGALPAHEALNPAWDRLKRAEEILEAEQAHLCDDRLQLRDVARALQEREAAVAVREAELHEREKALAAAEPTATVEPEEIVPEPAVNVARLILRTPRLT